VEDGILEAGVLAADGRLIEEQNLQVRESALTGEAQSVEKQAKQLPEETSLRSRQYGLSRNRSRPRTSKVVTGTGMQTELGRIAAPSSGE